jgi:hypothetical protein
MFTEFLQWITERGRGRPNGFYGDLICLLLLTPLCVISVYLCTMGSLAYLERGLWEGVGLAILTLFVLLAYLLWGFVTIRWDEFKVKFILIMFIWWLSFLILRCQTEGKFFWVIYISIQALLKSYKKANLMVKVTHGYLNNKEKQNCLYYQIIISKVLLRR